MNSKLSLRLDNAKEEKDPLKKSLLVLAILTEALKPEGIRPVLVGGRALEFYTLGGYATKDIDIVLNGRQQAKTALAEMGFQNRPGERHWYHEELDLALEMPDDILAGSQEKVVTLEIDDLELYIIGIEDLILDRLAAAKYWKSEADLLWAAKLLALHQNSVDWEYLKETGKNAQLDDVLDNARTKSKAYDRAD
ncbi:hypothetical protein SAMN05660649_02128 [Desulfotomaculum arcticum]|uniref:UbiD family decarboxylase n=1 Tax=Desulfotruncus arcticus DSM 17038 TaxID=1121424 RepID=A0A1I2TA71_9FIRM|nr:DUF6036 family nucleotidyltransferase [Desulfotruncus arcticus]SFG61758.1 hypothetical protein SAMN05660649_02128 [Desulfotomaculum arcticum] [Desulfotruncus arcticus DSM 17038]